MQPLRLFNTSGKGSTLFFPLCPSRQSDPTVLCGCLMAFKYSLKVIIKIRVYVSAAQILVGDFIGTVYCVGILQDVLPHNYAAVIMEVF